MRMWSLFRSSRYASSETGISVPLYTTRKRRTPSLHTDGAEGSSRHSEVSVTPILGRNVCRVTPVACLCTTKQLFSSKCTNGLLTINLGSQKLIGRSPTMITKLVCVWSELISPNAGIARKDLGGDS